MNKLLTVLKKDHVNDASISLKDHIEELTIALKTIPLEFQQIARIDFSYEVDQYSDTEVNFKVFYIRPETEAEAKAKKAEDAKARRLRDKAHERAELATFERLKAKYG